MAGNQHFLVSGNGIASLWSEQFRYVSGILIEILRKRYLKSVKNSPHKCDVTTVKIERLGLAL